MAIQRSYRSKQCVRISALLQLHRTFGVIWFEDGCRLLRCRNTKLCKSIIITTDILQQHYLTAVLEKKCQCSPFWHVRLIKMKWRPCSANIWKKDEKFHVWRHYWIVAQQKSAVLVFWSWNVWCFLQWKSEVILLYVAIAARKSLLNMNECLMECAGNRKAKCYASLLPSVLLRAAGNASPWTLTSARMYEFTPETALMSVLSMAAIKSSLSLPISSHTS